MLTTCEGMDNRTRCAVLFCVKLSRHPEPQQSSKAFLRTIPVEQKPFFFRNPDLHTAARCEDYLRTA
jgi:hypothetical protein